MNKKVYFLILTIVFYVTVLLVTACSNNEDVWVAEEDYDGEPFINITSQVENVEQEPVDLTEEMFDKYSLWTNGTQLRGANTWQRIVVPKYDGDEFLGNDYIGPPYTQGDFYRLSALGANYVNLSHPGLFTERPPYVLDEQIQANLDHMIDMAAKADMFVVITFRTGPGRNDFTFYREDDWFAGEDLIETVWHDADAQQAWVEMWRYTAERYRENPVVVGYDLMCEPNAAEIVDEWNQDQFYASYGGSIQDWNRWYPEIVHAIRDVDKRTPILVAGEGYSAVDWLPYLDVTDEDRIVYMFHQYAPHKYTHQTPPLFLHYPGTYDADGDNERDNVDQAWLQTYLQTAKDFSDQNDVPVAVNEYGVQRWEPGAAQFMHDEMSIFEELGLNYALWVWDPEWQPWVTEVNAFAFRLGDNYSNTEETPNELQNVVVDFWARNTVRPSSVE